MKPELIVRQAIPEDEELLLTWVNDRLTRQNSNHTKLITPEEHHQWFCKKLKSTKLSKIYIVSIQTKMNLIDKTEALGQVRLDFKENFWILDYSLDSKYRSQGLAKYLLSDALNEFFNTEPNAIVLAVVKRTNIASCKVLKSLNFKNENINENLMLSFTLSKSELLIQ